MAGITAVVAIALCLAGAHGARRLHARPAGITQQPTEQMLGTDTVQAQCTQDTGGTCRDDDCYPWRKNATCSEGRCMCPADMCAYQGSCLPPSLLPLPSDTPKCHMETGSSCALLDWCWEEDAVCSGRSFSFTEGITLGSCVCSLGTCAVDGKCVESPSLTQPPARLDANTIVCPVLASLYNAGFLLPDAHGRVERLKVQKAIREGLNADQQTAFFFGITTAGFKEADVDEQFFTMAPLAESIWLLETNKTEAPAGEERYLNIFRMVENPAIMHQVAAAARGGPIDPACPAYPCEKRFDEFFGAFADQQGHIHRKELGEIASHIFREGYHGVAVDNLFTLTQGYTAREYLALAGFLDAFGRKDAAGEPYIQVEDFRHMVLHGTFPAGWTKPEKEWGAATVLETMEAWREQQIDGFPHPIEEMLRVKGLPGWIRGVVDSSLAKIAHDLGV